MNLETTYMGIDLRNPLVASASPLSQTVDGIRRLEEAGVGAVVLYSLFEEELRREADAFATLGTRRHAELRRGAHLHAGAARRRRLVAPLPEPDRAGARPSTSRVIGSLNGVTPAGWTRYARAIEEAGATAIELNVYDVPGDPKVTGADVEARHLDVVARVIDAVEIPCRGQAEPVLQLDRLDGHATRHRRRERPRALQPLPPARDRSRLALDLGSDRPVDTRRPAPAGDVDRDPARPGRRVARGVGRRRDVRRRGPVPARGRRRRHDGIGAPHGTAATTPGCCSAASCEWMDAKGFASLEDVRGLISVAREADPETRQRAGYVGMLEAAKQTFNTL